MESLLEFDAIGSAASLGGIGPPGMIHENVSNLSTDERQELRSAAKLKTLNLHETQVRLVNESGRLKRVVNPLAIEPPCRE